MLQLISFLLLFLFSQPSTSVTQDVVTRLEARYRSARTLQATFLERYTENGRVLRTEAGIAYFRRPGKMRWEYQSPEAFPRSKARIGELPWRSLQGR